MKNEINFKDYLRIVDMLSYKFSILNKNIERDDITLQGYQKLFEILKRYKDKNSDELKKIAYVSIKRELIKFCNKENKHYWFFYFADESTNIEEKLDFDFYEIDLIILDKQLSKTERRIFNEICNGHTISEISNNLKIEYKVVDNAIQRIKEKAKKIK